MIFKTIDDDSALFGQRIVSIFNARKIAQEQATMQLEVDIACLKQYEVACQSGTVTTEQFDSIMEKASVSAQQYAINIQNGTGSAKAYAQAQKANNVALQSVSTGAGIASKAVKLLAGTMSTIAITAIFSLISKGISLAAEKIDDYIHRNEIAVEKAEDLLDTFKSDIDNITSDQDKINRYADEFKELSEGVDDLGRNVSLTADEYLRYQNIVKEIVGINPILIEGYDDENNILAEKNGLIETSIQLLKDEYSQKVKNLALPENVETAINGAVGRYNTAKDDFLDIEIPASLKYSGVKIDKNGNRETGYVNQISQYIEDVIGVEFTGWEGGLNQYILDNADAIFDNLDEIKERASQTKDGWEGLNDNQLIDLMDYFKELYILYNDMNKASTSANPTLQYVAMAEDSYSELSDVQKKFISDYINGIQITSDTTEQEKENIRKSIISLTQELSHDDSTKQALTDLYAPPSDNETIEEYKNRIDSALKSVREYCEDNGIEIPVEIEDIEKSADKLQQDYENIINRFSTNPKTSRAIDEAKENLSFEYQKISDWGLDDYADQIKNDTIQTKFGNVDMDKRQIIDWNIDNIEKWKDALSDIKYYDKNGNFIESYYDQLEESAKNGESCIDTVFGDLMDKIEGYGDITALSFSHVVNNDDGTFEFLGQKTAEEYLYGILDVAKKDGDMSIDHILELDKKGFKNAEVYDAQGKLIGETYIHGIISGFNDNAEDVSKLTHFAGKFGAVQIAEREIADLEKKYGEDGSQKVKDFLDAKGISGNSALLDEFNEVTKDINNADEAILAWKNHVGQTSEATTFESVWSSTSDEVKKKLLDLAKSGEITPETLSSTKEYNELLEKTGISAENAKDQILDMLSVQERLSGATQGLNKLKSAYEEFKNKDIGFVTAETLESLPDVFKNLPEFNSFSKIAGNPESGTEKIQQAFNDIVKAYILDQETLQGLVGADSNTIQTYIANLKQMGVTNAEEVVGTASEVLNSDNKMINDAEKEYNEYLENKLKGGEEFLKSTASQNSILKNALGSTYQSDYNNWCDLLSKKAGAYNKFVDAIGGSYDDSKSVIQNMLDNGIDITMSNLTDAYTAQAEYNRQVEEYKKLNDSLKIDLSPITTDFNVNYSSSSSSSSSSSNSDFDWIQVKLEAISRTTDKLQKKFEKTFTVNSATKKFKDYLSQINSEISANKTAGQTYLNYFNSVGLSSEWKNKIKSGKYKIDKNVDSATADKISEAQGYWNNYLQTLETINQLEDERETAEDTYANKVIDHYNKQIEKQQKLLDLREKFVSIRATWSDFANTASDYRYEQSKNMEQIKTYDNAIAKYKSLQKTVAQGSDAWNTYNDQIKDNQDKISELTLSNAELSKSIMNLPLDNASKKIEKYSNNLSLLQTKYSSLNMADSKNKNIDLQQKQSANIKAANDAAFREANANLNSAWAAIRTKDLKTINKNAKKGNYLIQASDTREGYKAIVEYNNALTAQKKAYEEAEKASAEYYRTVQENTKNKWDNIINQYQTNYDYFNSKSSRASAYLDYRKSMGYSNTSIYQENAYKDQLQAQKDALAELEEERSKLDWNKIQKQYEAGELQRDDYFALAKTIKELDSSIYKAKSDINETNATINKIPFQRLEYQIGTLTNKQTELSNALSLKQKLNEAIKAEDYTSQINTNKQLEKLYISENEWLQEQLETVSVNSDKWKEWSDAIASNESKINSLEQSNEDLKDSLRSEVYIKPFEKMATKIDFLKERLNSFLGLVNDTDTMFDDKGAFTKNGEAALGLSLKNIDAAKSKIENIQNKIQEAQKLYNNGNNDIGYSEEEYANDMRQYISDMWNAVSESKSASDEIVNIYQEQGQAILDALNKEIDARSKALQKKKEYYDYDKTIKTKTKDIQSLETQIAAMQSMEDSLEKRKKLLELQEKLKEKQEDLKDTQLDHQINIVVNGLDDFSTKIQENFDDSVKELKTNLDKQAEIINKANSLYADSYNSIFEHLSKLMKYYGIDSSKLPSDLKDTTIGNLKGFSRGGVARDLSGIIKQNGDSLLATINPNETVLTERFTELMPHAVNIMEGLIKTPVIPPSSVMQPNVNIQFNVDGNVDSVTWETIKKEIPNISKQVQKDIYVDLKKSGALRK